MQRVGLPKHRRTYRNWCKKVHLNTEYLLRRVTRVLQQFAIPNGLGDLTRGLLRHAMPCHATQHAPWSSEFDTKLKNRTIFDLELIRK